jgi:hypothetical protein
VVRCGSAACDTAELCASVVRQVDWDIVKACKLPSPLKGVKGVPKRKKDKETQAQRTAHSLHEGDIKEQMHQETVSTWDYVSPVAITEEYLESMYRCVSSI